MTLGLSSILLHGGVHATEASTSGGLDPTYAVASVVLVGGIGGALYWYYGSQSSADQTPPAKQE